MPASAVPARERDDLARRFAEIASEAGVAVMDVYRSDFSTRSKADSSPVSDADERAEEIILRRLAQLLPGVPVLAEETAAREGVGGARGGEFLLVDPVDGTREFINRRGDFTVNIALVVDGGPTAGCVLAPAREEMFFGGASAFTITPFTSGAPIEGQRPISTRIYPTAGLVAVTSASHLDPETKAFLTRHGVTQSTGIGSSLKFCLLAKAEADVYPRWGPTMEWDTAAGEAVLRAAGGQVLRPDGTSFVYGKHQEGFRNGPFIAWGRDPLPETR